MPLPQTPVRDYLLTQQELNLTPYDEANAGSSVIFSIELLPPVKADALDYLDKNGDKPERKALAVLNLLNDAKPRILMVRLRLFNACSMRCRCYGLLMVFLDVAYSLSAALLTVSLLTSEVLQLNRT